MPALTNIRWEKFAQALASGKQPAAAYRAAGYSSRGKAARANGARLACKPQIKRRLKELQAENEVASRHSREWMAELLWDIVETPIGEIDASHRLCQAAKESDAGSECKMPDKLRAADLLCRMMGWTATDQGAAPADVTVVIGGDA